MRVLVFKQRVNLNSLLQQNSSRNRPPKASNPTAYAIIWFSNSWNTSVDYSTVLLWAQPWNLVPWPWLWPCLFEVWKANLIETVHWCPFSVGLAVTVFSRNNWVAPLSKCTAHRTIAQQVGSACLSSLTQGTHAYVYIPSGCVAKIYIQWPWRDRILVERIKSSSCRIPVWGSCSFRMRC